MKKDNLHELADVVAELPDRDAVIDFFRGILTQRELAEIVQRLQIVKLLKQGVSQRIISKQLGVGIATVTRGSKELQKGSFKDV